MTATALLMSRTLTAQHAQTRDIRAAQHANQDIHKLHLTLHALLMSAATGAIARQLRKHAQAKDMNAVMNARQEQKNHYMTAHAQETSAAQAAKQRKNQIYFCILFLQC